MKLEDRMRQSIKSRSGTVFLRSEVAGLGGRTQVTQALNAMMNNGELVRYARGIYGKKTDDMAEKNSSQKLEVIIREIASKLKLSLDDLPDLDSNTEPVLVTETRKKSILLTLVIDERIVQVCNKVSRKHNPTISLSLATPKKNIARFVQDLAARCKVFYNDNNLDRWAETVTRLAGDEVEQDCTEDRLVALKRAGKLSMLDVATVKHKYMIERKHNV